MDLKPTVTTGDFWYRPDMMSEHHAATARHWPTHAPLSFRHLETAACGQAGSRTAFAALSAHAKQQWLLVERCDNAVGWLKQAEAKRTQPRWRRDSLDPGRVQDVRKTLDSMHMLTEVAAGSGRAAVRWASSLVSGWAAVSCCDQGSSRARPVVGTAPHP